MVVVVVNRFELEESRQVLGQDSHQELGLDSQQERGQDSQQELDSGLGLFQDMVEANLSSVKSD